jgi:hypothetical protein
MALRTLVTGSDMCSAGDAGAGPSNAVGALVNQLLGAGKTQEQLRDLPAHHAPPPLQHVPLTAEAAAAAAAAGPSGIQIPGFGQAGLVRSGGGGAGCGTGDRAPWGHSHPLPCIAPAPPPSTTTHARHSTHPLPPAAAAAAGAGWHPGRATAARAAARRRGGRHGGRV